MSAEHAPMQSYPPDAQDVIRPVRFRAIVFGLLLSVPGVFAVVNAPQSNIFSLLVAPVSILLIAVAINALIGLLSRGRPLSRADLIVIYALVSVACVAGGEWITYTYSSVHAMPFLKDGNAVVREQIMPSVPSWMIVRELDQVKEMMVGGVGGEFALSKFGQFWPQYLAWGALILSVAMACLFINSLMRGAWNEREKLSFPIIQLPVAMTESGKDSMWRSRLMWGAFVLMFTIDMLNGLNYLYPNIPRIPVKQILDISPLLRDAPLNSMGEFNIGIYPFIAALGLFMPSELLFSMIVFFLLRKLTHIVLGMAGFAQGTFSGTYFSPGPPYFEDQAWGGVLALFVGALWFSRGYIREVWQDIRAGRAAQDGGFGHRAAFIGLVVCLGVVAWFGSLGGLPIYITLPYFGLFLAFSVVITRMRAQVGPPSHEFAFFGPTGFLNKFAGNQWWTDKQTVWLGHVFIFMNRIQRVHPMPTQLEAMKMVGDAGVGRRRFFVALSLASALGIGLGFLFLFVRSYRLGSPLGPTEGVNYVQSIMSNRHGPDPMGMAMTGFGFIFALGLDALRLKFPGFPLHPVGYVLGITYGIDYYWFGLLLALILKVGVQRYHGLRGYEKLRHAALGIMLAEYAAETIWMGMALITKQSTYTIGFNERGLGIQ